MARKTKTTTQFGAKFGSSVRKKYTKATTNLRQKRNCPECNSIKFKRIAIGCLLYTSPSPRDGLLSRMPSSA